MTDFLPRQHRSSDKGRPIRVSLDDECTVEVPEFDLDRLRECCTLTDITRWEPGRGVHWRRKPLTSGDWQTLVRVGGFLGAVFGATIVGFVGIPDVPRYGAAAIGAIAGAIVIVVVIWMLLPYAYPALNVDIDTHQRVVRWRVGRKRGETQFTEIVQLVLQGILEQYTPDIHQGSPRSRHASRPAYRCTIELLNEQGKQVPLIESERLHKGSRERAVRDMAPLIVALAEEMSVPWSFQEFTPEARTFLDRLFTGGGATDH